jgi:tetratricopeptide (TPR) repeat protein
MQSHADRYTYVPYLGLFVALVWGVARIAERFDLSPKMIATGAMLGVSLLTIVAYRQVSLWRSSESLYTHTLSFTENNEFVTSNLCMHYLQKSDAVTADEKCSSLLATMSPSADVFQVLGYVKLQTGKYEESERLFQEAARFAPESGPINMQLAQVTARLGNVTAAEQLMQRALGMRNPAAPPAIVAQTTLDIADAYAKTGRKDKAIEYYQKTMSFNPNNADARMKLERPGPK